METCHILALMFLPLFIIAIIFYSPMAAPIPHYFAVAADPSHHSKEICTKTTLYSFTYPVQKHKGILCHPNSSAEKKLNDYNILFNKSLVAGQHSSLIKCPNNDKNICSGWDYAKKYLR